MKTNKLIVKKFGHYERIGRRNTINKDKLEIYCLDRLEVWFNDDCIIDVYDVPYECGDASAALRLLESLKEHKLLGFELITDEKQN